MSCGLSDDALFVLNILYSHRCIKSSSGYHCKKLENILLKKISSKFDDIIKELKNCGYITTIKKSELKYYISSMEKTSYALRSHDFSFTLFRERKL
jgi:hypothetical protein